MRRSWRFLKYHCLPVHGSLKGAAYRTVPGSLWSRTWSRVFYIFPSVAAVGSKSQRCRQQHLATFLVLFRFSHKLFCLPLNVILLPWVIRIVDQSKFKFAQYPFLPFRQQHLRDLVLFRFSHDVLSSGNVIFFLGLFVSWAKVNSNMLNTLFYPFASSTSRPFLFSFVFPMNCFVFR